MTTLTTDTKGKIRTRLEANDRRLARLQSLVTDLNRVALAADFAGTDFSVAALYESKLADKLREAIVMAEFAITERSKIRVDIPVEQAKELIEVEQ